MKTSSQRRKQKQTETEVQAVRGRLRGALNDSLQGQEVDDISEDYEEDEKVPPQTPPVTQRRPQRGRPRKIPSTVGQSRTSYSLSPTLTSSKRRRMREREIAPASGQNQKIQAESFVMKLFDRSLDLSKYTEKTALYPICRAWMANQPRNATIRSYRETRSPSPTQRVDNGYSVLSQLKTGDIRDITTMPKRKKSDVPKLPPRPKLHIYDKSQKLYEDDDPLTVCDKQQLMAQHLSKWKGIKKNWQKHTKLFQQKHEVNFLILEELFKA